MNIIDDFLEQKEFDKLHNVIMGDQFIWCYIPHINNEEDIDNFQFSHMFYSNHASCSPFLKELEPILEIIIPVALYRIKANLLTKTLTIVENKFHVDMPFMSEEKQKQWTTSILYVNTNNGYTKFEDGTIVESVANRLVSFPSNMKHTGTSCTDEKTRVVINFNYFSKYFK